jgi:tetratricopeptide (TPR) repeat protein
MVIALVAVAAPAAAQETLADQLRKGIVEEETGKNLDKAIQAYQAVLARYAEDRKVAGTAQLRLADCYRKTGKREQAIGAYRRLLSEYADQASLLESSRRQLAALGVMEPTERGSSASLQAAEARVELAKRRVEELSRTLTSKHPELVKAQRELQDAELQLKAIADRPREVAPERPERPPDVATEGLRAPRDIPTETLAETRLALQDMDNRISKARDLVAKGRLAPSDVEALQVRRQALIERMRQQQVEVQLNQELMSGVQKEIRLVEAQIAAYEAKIQVGQASADDNQLLQLRRDLIALQRKLAELRAGVRR